MMKPRLGRLLTAAAGLSFIATAFIHHTGYGSITRLAAQAPVSLQPMIPILWLAFSVNLTVIGLMLLAVAIRPFPGARLVVAIAGLSPFASAALQVWSIGFVPPTAILLSVGVLTSTAAAMLRSVKVPSTPTSVLARP